MRTFWRDTRFQEFWRDIGVIVIALAVFTVPLLIVFNLVAGGWLAQTERIREESVRVLSALEKQVASSRTLSDGIQMQNKYFDEKINEIEKKNNAILRRLDSIYGLVKKENP